eukprot:CAMPEP_0181198506 /NCGR_PEP_ID=MMETSP1096-20121128/16658_1 /TAXON_ID=156174 ORGANISM="Chrysochromulina ericina, Strain CCMP281" /NCGR_SAMPLE_ID=MMETSP1096 /ASSEMBLY_ACC=CAM_ASM_000453 /LENGTH=149 /DNA_ID=CAMNT_0023288583 /DNA_START=423 /DNA_END=876 /DNA_ORIENTATION=+
MRGKFRLQMGAGDAAGDASEMHVLAGAATHSASQNVQMDWQSHRRVTWLPQPRAIALPPKMHSLQPAPQQEANPLDAPVHASQHAASMALHSPAAAHWEKPEVGGGGEDVTKAGGGGGGGTATTAMATCSHAACMPPAAFCAVERAPSW